VLQTWHLRARRLDASREPSRHPPPMGLPEPDYQWSMLGVLLLREPLSGLLGGGTGLKVDLKFLKELTRDLIALRPLRRGVYTRSQTRGDWFDIPISRGWIHNGARPITVRRVERQS
jgi:hypothetical protein